MSAVATMKLKGVTDAACARRALELMNFAPVREPSSYPRGAIATVNGADLGVGHPFHLVQGKDGEIAYHYDSDDTAALAARAGGTIETRIAQYYAAAKAEKHLADNGYSCEVVKDGGNVQVVGTAW